MVRPLNKLNTINDYLSKFGLNTPSTGFVHCKLATIETKKNKYVNITIINQPTRTTDNKNIDS